MKTLTRWFAGGVIYALCLATPLAEEPKPAPDEASSPGGTVPVQTVSTNDPAALLSAPLPLVEGVSLSPAAGLDGGLPQPDPVAQTRLQPPTQGELIERYGAGRYLFRKEAADGNPLHLLNPFAPAEYGGVGTPAPVWSWNPLVAPGKPALPRAFRDDRTHEAGGSLLNVNW